MTISDNIVRGEESLWELDALSYVKIGEKVRVLCGAMSALDSVMWILDLRLLGGWVVGRGCVFLARWLGGDFVVVIEIAWELAGLESCAILPRHRGDQNTYLQILSLPSNPHLKRNL